MLKRRLIAVFTLLVFLASESQGQESAAVPSTIELASVLKKDLTAVGEPVRIESAPEWFQNLMLRIVRDNVPHKYVREKDWGMTDKRWDGLRIRRKGALNWTTKRRWKEVNHGSWKRYEITQVAPEQNLTLRIENVQETDDGGVGFEVTLTSQVHVHGRRAQWSKGVQLYNVSADADAAVELRLWCEAGLTMDIRKFPPDVVLLPKVTRAELDVTEFHLQSVSKLDGPIVEQLSGSVHRILLDKIAEKREQLPQKINRQIAKNADRLRLSLSDFVASKWSTLTVDRPDQLNSTSLD